jgi:hypothetical protein
MLTGDKKNRQAYMELLGLSMSLMGLRHEFCFILRVDDIDFSKELFSNYESSSAIHLVRIDNLEKASFWYRNRSPNNYIPNDFEILHCTSAGLFELAQKSSLYKDALKITKRINKSKEQSVNEEVLKNE